MNKETFSKLKTGDIIENNLTKSRYVVINDGWPVEPVTQIRKSSVSERMEQFEIVITRKDKEDAY